MRKIYLFVLLAPLLMSTSTPVHMKYVAPYKTVAQAGIVIDGNNMFIADNDNLVRYDISQPAAPAETERQHMRSGIDTLYMYQHNLVVCQDNFYGNDVFDVSAGHFVIAGINWIWGSCNRVAVSGNKVLIADKPGYTCTGESADNSVKMYAFSSASTAAYTGSLPVQHVAAMVATDNTFYLSGGKEGVMVVDVQTNTVKKAIGSRVYYQLQISGNKLYARAASSLDCYDISSPQNPVLISQFAN